ncbi:MAG: hypothetical protein R6V10_14470 [bacterium]
MSKSLFETVRVFFFACIIAAGLAGANCGGSSGGGSDDSAPANNAPVVEQTFNPVYADEDTNAYVSDIPSHFSDPDGDPLSYSVEGFDKINAALSGSTIELSAPQDWGCGVSSLQLSLCRS